MRNLATFIGEQLRAVNLKTASVDALDCLAEKRAQDRGYLPPRQRANRAERRATAHHEAAHVESGLQGGCTILEATLDDNTSVGIVRTSEFADPLAHINFLLVGVCAEVRYSPSALHRYSEGCYDFLVARQLIDAWNARSQWPELAYVSAAKAAQRFVDERWRSIQNLALALDDAGVMDDHAARIFSGCGYEQ